MPSGSRAEWPHLCDFVAFVVPWTLAELSAFGQRVALVEKFVHQSGGLSVPDTG